jgi:hypothetical protein
VIWLAYVGFVLVFLSYARIPKSPRSGWAYGALGNVLYTIAFLPYRRVELLLAPVAFAALSAWNLWRELRKTSSN